MDTSPLAYQTIQPAPRQTPPSGEYMDNESLSKTYSPLLWLYRLLMRFTLGGEPVETQEAPVAVQSGNCNRSIRRRYTRDMSADDIAGLEQRILVARIFSRGLTAPQYLEKKARLFIHGRIRTYGLRSAGSRLLRRARLTCYDHGWWRMPRASALRGGMWDAQLPPN